MKVKRIEIEFAKNGFEVTIYKEEEESKDGLSSMYPSPDKYVATSKEEVTKLVEKHLK